VAKHREGGGVHKPSENTKHGKLYSSRNSQAKEETLFTPTTGMKIRWTIPEQKKNKLLVVKTVATIDGESLSGFYGVEKKKKPTVWHTILKREMTPKLS